MISKDLQSAIQSLSYDDTVELLCSSINTLEPIGIDKLRACIAARELELMNVLVKRSRGELTLGEIDLLRHGQRIHCIAAIRQRTGRRFFEAADLISDWQSRNKF